MIHSASVRIPSASTAGRHFSQTPVRSLSMLLSLHLMTQNDVPVNVFPLMGTGNCLTGLCLVNSDDVEAHQGEFWRGTLLPIGLDVLGRCHAEDISCHSARTEAVYDEWILSNDAFEKHLELEVNEDDIEDLIMGHEDELMIEEHQETQRNVSPSEQEKDERGPMPTSAFKDLLKKWEAVRAMVLRMAPKPS
ncbi:uncharacterized protein TNCV_5059711 [Trichonephila clavipes]|nr:uncharacterized protein TNCV_5059711 [Trichonephila clavipes]